jgi:hypothetical protein
VRTVFAISFGLVVIACSAKPSAPVDAGIPTCVDPQPCSSPWRCTDDTHWSAEESGPCPAECHDVGDLQTCPPDTACVDLGSPVPCAIGGIGDCLPDDEAQFVPPPMASPPVRQMGACTDAEVEQLFAHCYGSLLGMGDCEIVREQDPTCTTCLEPVLFQPQEGSSEYAANAGGCFAFLDQSTAPGSCAALADAQIECAFAACAYTPCGTTRAAFASCIDYARANTCSAFAPCAPDASASWAICEAPALQDFYIGFGEVLCGP